MKKIIILALICTCISFTFSCGSLQPMYGSTGDIFDTGTSSGTSTSPTHSEIKSGLKQALQIGLKEGIQQVSATNGFLKNPLIKVVFPPEAQKIERTLRNIGLGSLCDKVVLSLNRAAEDASKKALPIFMNALKNMSFQDVTGILLGKDTAATHYFRTATTSALTQAFQPVIAKSLDKVDATKYWGTIMNKYNQIPLVQPVNTNLSAYVTQKAIDGLFKTVAQKEINIRENLSARTTPLLKKVFGYADRKE